MKITKAALLVWLFASMQCFGAVEAVLFHITTNETFTIPAGKVLIIENMMASMPGGPSGLKLENGTNSFTVEFGVEGINLPAKVPGEWTLRGAAGSFGPGTSTDVWVFGLLAAPADLFASAQHRIDQISVAGGLASLGIQMASPRPARITVEKSSEAGGGWHAAENAVVRPTADKSRYVATVPMDGHKGFLRTKARPVER